MKDHKWPEFVTKEQDNDNGAQLHAKVGRVYKSRISLRQKKKEKKHIVRANILKSIRETPGGIDRVNLDRSNLCDIENESRACVEQKKTSWLIGFN